MDLLSAIFSVARNISDSDINDINRLHEKAKNDVSLYHDEQKGFKGFYARMHKGWLLQTVLIFVIPFLTTWLISKKQTILNSSMNNQVNDFDDYDDELEEQEYERLKQKYDI
jgi:hypothetical protein